MNEKKQRELRLIEHTRTLCDWFPEGELHPEEEPDAILATGADRLGIEVAQLHEPPIKGQYPRRQIEEFHVEVMETAERTWATTQARPLDVWVYFGRADLQGISATTNNLIEFVKENLPDPGGCNQLENGVHAPFSTVRIMDPNPGDGNRWRCYQAGSVPILTAELLADAIARKNHRIDSYRRKADRVWLLLSAPIFPLSSSFSIPPGFEEWRFAFDFDKVLLYQWERGVIELRRN